MWRYCFLCALLLTSGGAALWWWQHTSTAEYRLCEGQRALERGDDATAERYLLLLEADGRRDQAHLLRGEIFVREEQYARALAECNQIRDHGELRVQAAVVSGRCLLELEQPRKAVEAFRFVLQQRPDHLVSHRGLAQAYYNQGRLILAIRHCHDWARLDPADGRPLRLEALIHTELANKDEAVVCYRGALQRQLSDRVREEVRLELSDILVQQHQYRAALGMLDECSDETATTDKAQTLRAECQLGLGQKAKASALLDRVLSRRADAQAMLLRASLYLERDDATAAADLLRRAIQLEPHQFAGRHLLAQAYQMLGKSAEAEEQERLGKQTQAAMDELTDLTRKQAADPLDAGQHRRMAELYDRIGMPRMADRSRRLAFALDPTLAVPGKGP
jgi:tetratricopeptide (TPR) repeat protein